MVSGKRHVDFSQKRATAVGQARERKIPTASLQQIVEISSQIASSTAEQMQVIGEISQNALSIRLLSDDNNNEIDRVVEEVAEATGLAGLIHSDMKRFHTG